VYNYIPAFLEQRMNCQYRLARYFLPMYLMANSVCANQLDLKFSPLQGVYEPSGGIQLEDGRILIIEDEAQRAFSLMSLQRDTGTFMIQKLQRRSFPTQGNGIFNDLEGIALSPNGLVYAITSHSRKASGKRDKDREKLIRFTVENSRSTNSQLRLDLRQSLISSFDFLYKAASNKDTKKGDGFGVEGLAFDPQGKILWLGFREPIIDGKAVLVGILNPADAFEHNKKFIFTSTPLLLDFKGGGIRDIVYDRVLNGYLIATQREGKRKNKLFKLWFWNGSPDIPPKRVRISGVNDLERTEGIVPLTIDGKAKLLLLSDSGSIKKRKPANYLLVDYSLLTMKPKKRQ